VLTLGEELHELRHIELPLLIEIVDAKITHGEIYFCKWVNKEDYGGVIYTKIKKNVDVHVVQPKRRKNVFLK
jgi:hypothetical protein